MQQLKENENKTCEIIFLILIFYYTQQGIGKERILKKFPTQMYVDNGQKAVSFCFLLFKSRRNLSIIHRVRELFVTDTNNQLILHNLFADFTHYHQFSFLLPHFLYVRI